MDILIDLNPFNLLLNRRRVSFATKAPKVVLEDIASKDGQNPKQDPNLMSSLGNEVVEVSFP